MWLVSFKAIKLKINEYGKKKERENKKVQKQKKKEHKEYKAQEEITPKSESNIYELSELLSLLSHAEYQSAIESLYSKINNVLLSLSHKRYNNIIQSIYAHLGRSSIYELEIL